MGDDQVVARLKDELWALIEDYAEARDGYMGDARQAHSVEELIWGKLDELVSVLKGARP